MKNRKILTASVLIIVLAVSMAFTASQIITVKGSDTMVILAQKWAEGR